MFLHIGGEYIIKSREIIGVFDLENTTISKITKEYLKNKEINGNIVNVNNEIPKTFIVINKNKKIIIYLSSISSKTLLKRVKNGI